MATLLPDESKKSKKSNHTNTTRTSSNIRDLARLSRVASRNSYATVEQRNAALTSVKASLLQNKDVILAANRADLEREQKNGTCSEALMKRLVLDDAKFDSLVAGIDGVLSLPDPNGVVSMARELEPGLELYRVSCPIGVLCVIFEARPDAAVQIASLAIKSANSVILKGGSEAYESNQVLVRVIREGLENAGTSVPVDAVQLVATRQDIAELLELDEYIDLVIPRGSNALVKHIKTNTKIPVMGHADGICSVYIDTSADPSIAVNVAVDSKINYPAACNAAETLLIHRDCLDIVLPKIGVAMEVAGVTMHADVACLSRLPANCSVPAKEEDYRTEWLSMDITVKCVDGVEEAIRHVNEHGSGHTDCIVTENAAMAEMYMQRIDSAGVYHNASTRFADGFRYGFGAEVGVSTNRIHARGPVGLEGLTTYKYRMYGSGQKCSDFGSDGKREYTHRDLQFQLPACN
jgi:glutamate-5-semialdehyde dehydrogenase